MVAGGCPPATLCGISSRFQLLSPPERQLPHALLTRSPLSLLPKKQAPFDLHVLGTPPAFVLSQDQTLNKWYLNCPKADKIVLLISFILATQIEFFKLHFRATFEVPFSGVSFAYIV